MLTIDDIHWKNEGMLCNLANVSIDHSFGGMQKIQSADYNATNYR